MSEQEYNVWEDVLKRTEDLWEMVIGEKAVKQNRHLIEPCQPM